MKAEYIVWILIALFAFAAFISWVVWTSSEGKKGEKSMGQFASIAASIFFFVGVYDVLRLHDYWLWDYQSFNEEYNLPLIDSCMYVYKINDEIIEHREGCRDSISHISKITTYDLFDVYDVTDRFRNQKTSENLTYYFVKPNIIRDPLREVYFEGDTLTKLQGDSILKEWGLYERAYTLWYPRY